jgi:hypothetical protein
MVDIIIVIIAVIVYRLIYEKCNNTYLFFAICWSIVLACDIIALITGIKCTWDLVIMPVACLVLDNFYMYFSIKRGIKY